MKLQESSNLYTEFLLCQTSQTSATMCSIPLVNEFPLIIDGNFIFDNYNYLVL